MTWEEAYADAGVLLPLNNSMSVITNNTNAGVFKFDNANNNPFFFVEDAPPGSPYTHSVRINGYSTGVPSPLHILPGNEQPIPNNAFGNNTTGVTYSFWYKVDSLVTPQNIGNTITFFTTNLVSGGQPESMSITGGSNIYDTGSSAGKMSWNNTYFVSGASNLTSTSTGQPDLQFQPDMWHHIVFNQASHTNNNPSSFQRQNLERSIFVNGKLVARWSSDNHGGFNYTLKRFLNTNAGSLSTSIQKISSFASWAKPLTTAQIKNLYIAGITPTSDYSSVILADNPDHYIKFNNPDKNTPVDIGGTQTTWEPINDDSNVIAVNEESKFGKSWKIQNAGDASQNIYNAGVNKPNLMAGLGVLARSGEMSMEYWFKSAIAPSSTRTVLALFNNQSASAGRLDIQQTNFGTPQIRYATKTSTATAIGTIVSARSTSNQLNNGFVGWEFYNEALSNNEWHHIVFVLSKSESINSNPGTTVRARIYVNGIFMGATTITTTLGYLIENGIPLDMFAFGSSNGTATVNRDFWIDKLAFYPYKLSPQKVNEHYLAGATYLQAQTGAVKYWDGDAWYDSSAQKVWNGTEWIDWDHRYWNGTDWVTL